MPDKKNNIETEIRSFITSKQHRELLRFFKRNGKFLGEENQVTYYFSGAKDLRIQKTNGSAKLWLKGGKIHENHREDIVVRCDGGDFGNLETLLLRLGYNPEIRWFRKRNNFFWRGISVAVDFTRGYGHILELEKMGGPKDGKKNRQLLLAKLKELGVKLTPKEEFAKKFSYYKKNWRKLV